MVLGRSVHTRRVLMGIALLALSTACWKSTAQENRTPAPVPPPATLVVAESIYDGHLVDGWQDWGWGTHELKKGSPARVNMTNYGGIIFHHDALSMPFGGLVFRVKAPQSFGNFLSVRLGGGQSKDAFPEVAIGAENARPASGGAFDVYVPWTSLNPNNLPVDQIMIHARVGVGTDWVELDKVALTRPNPGGAAPQASGGAAPARTVTLSVQC